MAYEPPPSPALSRRPTLSSVLRLAQRRLVFAALLAVALLYLLLSGPQSLLARSAGRQPWRPYSVNPDKRPPSPYHPRSRNTTAFLDEVKEWWKPWVTAIKSAKPDVDEIEVRAPHPVVEPDEPRSPRGPARDVTHLAEADVRKLHDAHARFRRFVDEYPLYERDVDRLFHHRGVVLVGGGEFYGPAIVSILMLRDTGSALPVELFLPTWAEYEPALCEDYLPRLKAKCLVLDDFLMDHISHPVRGVGHYQLKALALLFSSFRNVLLLDSDSIPLLDPAALFDSAAYARTGLVTWPDLWRASELPAFWTAIAGLPAFPPDLPAASPESGQMVVDKARHLPALMLAVYYNVYGPGRYYTLLSQGALGEGDKTTFEAAATVTNASFYRVHRPLAVVGRSDRGQFLRSAMVQFAPESALAPDAAGFALHGGESGDRDEDQRPAFVHANTPKMNAGHLVDEGDLVAADDGVRLRLFGDLPRQMALFGEDLERRVWRHLAASACELEGVLAEWVGRPELCKRVRAHVREVFG